jgi:hypothetical protein
MLSRFALYLFFLPMTIPFRIFLGLSGFIGVIGWSLWLFFTLKWVCDLTDAGFSVVRAQACLAQLNSPLNVESCGREIAESQFRFLLEGFWVIIPSYYFLEVLAGWRSFSSIFDICWARVF